MPVRSRLLRPSFELTARRPLCEEPRAKIDLRDSLSFSELAMSWTRVTARSAIILPDNLAVLERQSKLRILDDSDDLIRVIQMSFQAFDFLI